MIRHLEYDQIPDIHCKPINYVFEENLVPDYGLWLEFGVYAGGTIHRIASRTNRKCIYGFDSFEGLPENWEMRDNGAFPKGAFNLNGWMPEVPDNVTLIKGWFKDTLPTFIKEHPQPITFMHVDSDIYSSAKDILTHLAPQISNGCIIVFDEMIGYYGFEFHEWKAWWEFVEEHNITYEWIGGNVSRIHHPRNPEKPFAFDHPAESSVSPSGENVAVRIINNPSFKALHRGTMILISHRGNVNEILPNRENSPDYIDEAIAQGYGVEIDVRLINGVLSLGHDFPQYDISLDWLLARNKHLWIHCKNFAALSHLIDKDVKTFYHQKENHTIINNCNLIWSHELSEADGNSIIPLLSKEDIEKPHPENVYGICSDFVEILRDT